MVRLLKRFYRLKGSSATFVLSLPVTNNIRTNQHTPKERR